MRRHGLRSGGVSYLALGSRGLFGQTVDPLSQNGLDEIVLGRYPDGGHDAGLLFEPASSADIPKLVCPAQSALGGVLLGGDFSSSVDSELP